MTKQHSPFWMLAIAYGTAFILPFLLSEGTFLDGLIYAVLARNLAEGAGSFWAPHFTETTHNSWFEHPPLGLNIESVFYRILGEAHWVEHVHSAFIMLLCLWLIVVIWRFVTENDKHWLKWQTLGAMSVTAAFLTKGVVGVSPW